MKILKTLRLLGTDALDKTLTELAALKGLQSLDLGETRVTDAALIELRKALPVCKILR